jgi:hypothetical protein
LPIFYSRRKHNVFAEYDHRTLADATDDFLQALPGGVDVFHSAVRKYLTELYKAAASPEALYFLDKTPRYHLISEELLGCFPDGKFIVLWRNPLAIASSMMTTWANGRWNLYRFKVDLYKGVDRLTTLVERHRERLCIIRYEDLVSRPDEELKRIFDYLEITQDLTTLQRFSELELNGRMGDPTGIRKFPTVSADSIVNWKASFQNPLRKMWARRYLKRLSEWQLEIMGYSSKTLQLELAAVPNSAASLASDLIWMPWGFAYSIAEPYFIYQKLRALRHYPQVVPDV